MKPVNIALVVALLAAFAVLAACGGDGSPLSKNDYRSRLAALSQREGRAHADLQKGLKAKDVAGLRTRLARFADDQQTVGRQVAGFKAPKDAEAANRELARGLRDTATEVRSLVARLRTVKTVKARS